MRDSNECGQTHGWLDEQQKGRTDRQTDRRPDGQTDSQADGQLVRAEGIKPVEAASACLSKGSYEEGFGKISN